MKLFKSLTFAVLLIFGLSGCYTQLQYSQKMKRVTDREPVEEYSWDGEERAHANTGEYEGDAGVVSDYVPPYKDYETEQFYDKCNCAYSDYREGYLDGVDDALTALKYNYSTSYFRFTIGNYHPYFSFGYNYSYSPFYSSYFHSRWYHPFYYSPYYYHSFYRGYGPYFGYNYYHFYNGGGYYYGHNNRDVRDNRRYGPRSTGGSRIGDDATRTRSGTASDIRSRTRSTQGDVRTRSNNGSQSRGTVDRSRSRTRDNGNVGQSRTRSGNNDGSVQRTRSRGNSSDGNRSRSRSSVNSQNGSDEYRSRVGIMQNRYSRSVRDIQSEVNRRNALENARERYRQQNRRVSGGSFWERLNNALTSPNSRGSLRSRINNSNSDLLKSLRSRSNNSNSTRSRSVQRSRNDNRSSGSSVNRSRSKSSGSSGSNSRSRSRSGGNDDDRSRSRSGGN